MKIDVLVPDGKSGNWAVETFTVSEEDAKWSALRAMFSHGDTRVPAGTYKRLMRGRTVVMSNTPMEIRSNIGFIHRANGNVLINGLGLGMVLGEILKKKEVTEVTVIEISEDVIKLVGPTFSEDKRVKIIHADALQWKPPKGVHYDCAYHDIWNSICADNLESMEKLHRKYGGRADWQSSWEKRLCQYYKRQSARIRY